MYVYFKDGSKRRWIADVHLKDGFCPCVGKSACSNNLRMEPAIWFKVLVLESISLDCGKRVVSWSTKNEDNDDSCARNFFCDEGDCYDYDDDTDELFKLAYGLMDGDSERNSKSGEEHNLLRMLHCYILPRIPLHIEDLGKVNRAREKQIQSIQSLDEQVIQQCKVIDECKAKLEDVRTRFLPQFEEIAYKYQFPKGFLSILMDDVATEEDRLRCEVNKAQDCVQLAKDKCAKKPCGETENQLARARQQRNEFQQKLECLLNCREVIADVQKTVMNHVGGPVAKESRLLQNYLQVREELGRKKEGRDRLLEQKKCALSVREMLDGAIAELNEKGFTEANEANAQGTRPSDVLQGVWHPEWQKLGERVATIVSNREHPIGSYFQTFCEDFQDSCRQLISLGKGAETGKDLAVSCMRIGPCSDDGGQSSYELLGLDDFRVSSHRQQLENLKEQISKHLKKATDLLAELFNNKEKTSRNKLQLCYEQCFYDRVHTFIECVYELAHYKHIGTLEQDVRRLKKLPIKLLDLQVKDEWWLQLFDPREHSGNLTGQTLLRQIPQLALDQQGLGESYDMIDDFIEELDGSSGEMEGHFESITDVNQVRSLCINVIRNRSRTFNDELGEESATCGQPIPASRSYSCSALSTSAPPQSGSCVTLGDIMTHWETKQGGGVDTLTRQLSKSHNALTQNTATLNGKNGCQNDTFEDHFGPSLQRIRDIFKASSPLAKLKCLTSSLRKITDAVQELRKADGADELSAAVTAEDLLPLVVLMMLQMEPWEVAVMWPQLSFMEDLMPDFLTSGCHGWALVEFQMAQRFLHTLCAEF